MSRQSFRVALLAACVAMPVAAGAPSATPEDPALDRARAAAQVFSGQLRARLQAAREGLPDGVALRMMRGIVTERGCLACHGRDIAPQIREAIIARYPDDHATGFAVGDLRGALWVQVPSAPATTGAAT